MLERAWASGLSSRPRLDPDAIIAAAARREGDRPSDGCWRDRLSILCAALNGEAALNPLGRTIAHGQLVKLVAARVRAERLFARHPAIRRRPLGAPLVIVGQMRSGTTRMHRLLACDPHFACNRLFEQLDPVPPSRRPSASTGGAWSASLVGAGLHLLEPRLAAIHPSRPDAAEEEFGLHAYSIWGPLFEGQWRVPSFAGHVEQADPAPVYREFADLLRLIGWARGDDAQRAVAAQGAAVQPGAWRAARPLSRTRASSSCTVRPKRLSRRARAWCGITHGCSPTRSVATTSAPSGCARRGFANSAWPTCWPSGPMSSGSS